MASYLPVGSCLHQGQLSSKASVAVGTVVQLCWNCLSSCSLGWAAAHWHRAGLRVFAGRCNSLIPLPLGLSTNGPFHRPPELTACSVNWVSAEESMLWLFCLRKSQLCTDNLFPLYRACYIASNKCIYPELKLLCCCCQVGLNRMLSVPWGYQVIQQLQQCSREDKQLIMAFISWPWLLHTGGENVIKSLSFCLVKL